MKLSDKGFTLSELMIAASIMLIAILGLLAIFINGIFVSESNRNQVIAANDAQYVLEQIRSLPYSQITTYSPPALNNLNNETINLTRSIGANIADITVEIGWLERRRSKNFALSTRIAD